jgi:rhamnogalacturonan endolyase
MQKSDALVAVMALLIWISPALAADPAVVITPQGNAVRISNGIVSFSVNKANGDFSDLLYRQTKILAEPTYLDWISGGNNHISKGEFSVVVDPSGNDGEMAEVEISQKYAPGGRSPFDVELHYVLRRGDSGPYVFVVFSHPASYPAGGIGQSRWVNRVADGTFNFINDDEQRRFIMPPSNTPTKALGPKESLLFTAGPFKGQITDKYHFYVDVGDHFFHGWSGTESNVGAWIVYGSNEAQNGGPTKQHNSVQFGQLLFKILVCGHYGAAGVNVAAGENWRKVYGPWMLYLNHGSTTDAMWEDAKRQAQALRAAWPPSWMHHPDFPLEDQRATVTGQLQLQDDQDPQASIAGAWVGLAAASPDWQQQANGYQFWVHAGADGKFSIPHVRAGSYTLYSFGSGVMDEFRHDNVEVKPGESLDLGALAWKPVRYGQQVWQIGTPDRTAKEFRHGDDYRQWGLWQKYPVDFPNDVNFIIGKSDPRKDWNYAQVFVQKNGQWTPTTWHILFDHPATPQPGLAVLRIALASTHNVKLSVFLNDKRIGGFNNPADNAMIRAGIHGQYSEQDIAFDAALIKQGQNTIGLQLGGAGNVQKSLMYDCIRLEVDNTHPFDKDHLPSLHHGRTAAAAPEQGD